MKTLEYELGVLQKQRNNADYTARNWRAKADEVFTLARYVKEDFDSDSLDKKRAVVTKLGEKLTILDRTIHFTPNKYFIPIEKMNESDKSFSYMVRTDPDKIKTPANEQVSLSWLRRLGSNQ